MKHLSPGIPMHMSIDYGGGHHDDDTVEHEIKFEVVKSPATYTAAVVQSDGHANPRVLRYLADGKFDMPRPVLDQIVILCFKRLIARMMPLDGNSADVWVKDAAEWFQRRLAPRDAAVAIAALSAHVVVGVATEDFAWVRQD
jgi:hypothetical protein